jgi:hypothetical protein
MNESTKNNNQEAMIYPPYMQVGYDDEINLVELWISLKAYKKQFFIYFMVVFVVLAVLALSIYKEKYEISSSLQVGTIETLNGTGRAIDSLEATKSKLNNVFIPMLTHQWIKQNDLAKTFKTSISTDKGSDVILVKNKVMKDDAVLFSHYQKELLALMITDHDKKLLLSQTDILRDLRKEELLLAQLNTPITLELKLKKQALDIKNKEGTWIILFAIGSWKIVFSSRLNTFEEANNIYEDLREGLVSECLK